MPLRNNKLGSGRFGYYEVNDPLSSFEINDKKSIELAEKLINLKNEKN